MTRRRARIGFAASVILLLAPLLAACAKRERFVLPAPDGDRYDWNLPAGFPRPVVPADNPMTAPTVELGRRLFYDTRLSGNGSSSCSSCHRQELAFTDGRPRAVGSTGELHPRSAMSLTNVAYNATLAWADPRLTDLEAQARVPMFNETPVELGLAGRAEDVLARLRADGEYRRRFAEAFPVDADPITIDNVVRAIACFERTLISGRSPYDRLVYGGESDALPPSARRGMRLFFSDELGCSKCHAGFNFSGPVSFRGGEPSRITFHNTALYDLDGNGAYPAENQGVLEITASSEDMGRFRAPTLRNVGLTAPYMHDGSIATLEQVIEHYAQGGRSAASPIKSELLTGFEITAGQTSDLLAFLRSLTDESFVRDRALSDPFGVEPRREVQEEAGPAVGPAS